MEQTDETRNAVKRLDGVICSLTELYREYARRFGLWEVCLGIFFVSHFDNEGKVDEVWTMLLRGGTRKGE